MLWFHTATLTKIALHITTKPLKESTQVHSSNKPHTKDNIMQNSQNILHISFMSKRV